MRPKQIFVFLFSILIYSQFYAQPDIAINFYPLHIGDVWQYKITYTPPSLYTTQPDPIYLSKKVLKDTVLANGKKYFVVEQPPFTYKEIKDLEKVFIRIDSTNNMVYEYNVLQQTEKAKDSLFIGSGDLLNRSLFCTEQPDDTVFSQSRKVRLVSTPTSSGGNSFWWNEAMDIGIFSQKNNYVTVTSSGNHYELIYAKINGVEYGILVDVKDNKENIPAGFYLAQNYPNPFNPTTVISYRLPVTGHVSLKVYDVLGKEVATLVNEFQQAGIYYSAFSILHSTFSSSVYLYRLTAGKYSSTRKMIVLK